MTRFTICGETYTAKPFSFRTLVEINKMGIKIADMNKMDMALLNAYFAVCAEIDEEEAMELIEKHVIEGGNIDELSKAMTEAMDSDFFRALTEQTEARKGENLQEAGTDSRTGKNAKAKES